MALSESQKANIVASIPFLEANGVELTSRFYSYMLEAYPEVRPFFNKANQITKRQPKILAFALLKYAENINDLTPLLSFVRQIVEKHVGLQVTADQYDIVGTCLLKTLKEMLGDAATDDFMKSWEVAYFDLANILIGMEKARYDDELKIKDAWLGFKKAKVTKLVSESNDVKSVYIETEDGKYADFNPGQYITIRLSTDGGETIQSREYSLSNEYSELAKGLNHYRISVKRLPDGLVSNYIHDKLRENDEILISSPYGKLLEPYLKNEATGKNDHRTVLYFVGGIGITPSISSIEYFLSKGRPVKLFLSNANLKQRVFGSWIEGILRTYGERIQIEEYISEIDSDNIVKNLLPTNLSNYKLIDHRLSEKDLVTLTEKNANEFDYYLIGPLGYMTLITNKLTDIGVNINLINSEQYGPTAV